MKKYNIIYTELSISDSEIEQYMNFSELIIKKEKSKTKTTIQSNIKTSLLSLSLISAFFAFYYFNSKINKSPVQEKPEEKTKTHQEDQLKNIKENISNPVISKPKDIPDKNSSKKIENIRPEQSENIPEATESFVEATPKDGYAALYEYFASNIEYPEKAKKDSASGTILIEFVVSEKGKIEKIKVVKGETPELDKEAKRLIAQMPQWKPATINGRTVSVKLTLPLSFQLEIYQ